MTSSRRKLGRTGFARELSERRAQSLYRTRRIMDSPSGVRVQSEGCEYLSFCSNDYLGLANDARVQRAAIDAISRYGVGSGAAHLVCGHQRIHHELEERLAEFTGRARALLFSTGYMANLGIAGALLKRGDNILQDKWNHASLIDAARLSDATLLRYHHGDIAQLEMRLARITAGAAMIMTDGVFSMDGDLADLPTLARLAKTRDACLVVDDAHGIGVLGARGRGSLEHFSLDENDVPVLMGTLGKALGGFGAFVAGSEELIEMLIQFARTYIYTTALPPMVAAAGIAALEIVEREPERRMQLEKLVARFRSGAQAQGLSLGDSSTPIQPIIVGDSARALRISDELASRGVLVTAIRPPTVPAGSARLRVTLSAAHQEADIDRLLECLGEISWH